jgi:hypothetical protein
LLWHVDPDVVARKLAVQEFDERVMSNKMWGGRYTSGPDSVMEDINASIDFDRHLYRQDITASKAHAQMLAKQGIIAADDAQKIAHGLDTILSGGGRAAAYRALAQRSGGDRLQAVGAR